MTAPIAYIVRTRAYYHALGYGSPYQWAHFQDTPFTVLGTPISDARIALITTAAPFQIGKGDQGPGAPYNAAAKFYEVYEAPLSPIPDLRISHIAIDRDHTTAQDMGTWFPVLAMKRAEKAGRIGSVVDPVFGLPTNRSIRHTMGVDCPDLVGRCQNAGVDAAILVPNCPVCHQSVSLAARALEAEGIPTVIMGCALDIVEHVGVARFVFSDFPLGNSCGRPGDEESQDHTLGLALSLLETATGPRTTRKSTLEWKGRSDWKSDYSNAARLTADEIATRRAGFEAAKGVAKSVRTRNQVKGNS